MVRKVTPAQYNALVRQHNAKVRQYNQRLEQEIRRVNQHNQEVVRKRKRAIDEYNREVRRYNQQVESGISKYNQAVRTHNAHVRANQQRQIAALRSRPAEPLYSAVRTSTYELYDIQQRVAQESERSTSHQQLVALSEQESGNSLSVMNSLLASEDEELSTESSVGDTGILEFLQGFSEDLCKRWQGAVYALNPKNPDAARHFCTSVREVFTEILEIAAPDTDVIRADADCELMQHSSKPTRRSKINYLLQNKGIDSEELEEFVEADIDNIIDLFGVFNSATHGPAGKHEFAKLQAIKKRVEGGIMFLATLAVPA